MQFSHPTQAHEAGLSTVFQEFNLLPDRTVAENIYLGREPRKGLLVSRATMNADTADAAGVRSDHRVHRPTSLVRSLSVAEQQIVEIAKAVATTPGSSPWTSRPPPCRHEVALLYGIVQRLAERGMASSTSRTGCGDLRPLPTITVLKDGGSWSPRPAAELDDALMVRHDGRPPDLRVLPRQRAGAKAAGELGEPGLASGAAPATPTSTAST